LAILGQKSLNRFGNTFPVQKIKNSHPFCLKGTKGKQIIQRKTITKHFQRKKQRKITKLGLQQEFSTHMYLNLRKQLDSS
jgi:hypothetical protein